MFIVVRDGSILDLPKDIYHYSLINFHFSIRFERSSLIGTVLIRGGTLLLRFVDTVRDEWHCSASDAVSTPS